jgi:hypothetical protein
MKKSSKKLVLKREALRTLPVDDVRNVAGGFLVVVPINTGGGGGGKSGWA